MYSIKIYLHLQLFYKLFCNHQRVTLTCNMADGVAFHVNCKQHLLIQLQNSCSSYIDDICGQWFATALFSQHVMGRTALLQAVMRA